jgi:hypothetical protein
MFKRLALLADPVEFLNAISNGERDAPVQKRLRDAAAALSARWEHLLPSGLEKYRVGRVTALNPCQSASKIDPLSASKIDPPCEGLGR